MLSDKNINDLISSTPKLIENHNPEFLHNCTYTLSVGSIFEPETGVEEIEPIPTGKIVPFRKAKFWIIGPTECLIIKTKEKLNIPKSVCAYYGPLNRLAQKGVMLLNASVVEPGYSGHLSCFLVNLSSHDVEISEAQAIAKISFHKLDGTITDYQPLIIDNKNYEKELSQSARLFEKTFLGVKNIEERAKKAAMDSVSSSLKWGGGFLLFLIAFSQAEPFVTKYLWEKLGVISTSRRVDEMKLKNDMDSAQKEIADLKLKIKNDGELINLESSIKEMQLKIRELEKHRYKK